MPSTARADNVGSLIRPPYLKEVRQAAREGKATPQQRTEAEDRAVSEAIAMQERVGLDVLSDGELRRAIWIATGATALDAAAAPVAGFEGKRIDPKESIMSLWQGHEGHDWSGPPFFSYVTGKISENYDLAAHEYRFLADHTSARKKYTLPAPSWHRVHRHPDFSRDAYPTADDFLEDMSKYLRSVFDRVIAMGCDYVQLDAPNYAMFHTDPEIRAWFEARGHDLDKEIAADADFDNSVFEGLRARGITCALHVCRGNPGGDGHRWMGDGGYETIAPAIFPRLTNIDTLLLEYDSPRAGDFPPLQHMRDDTTAVLGLMTTKLPAVESAEELEGRIREASQYVPLERLALSPQCGFASVEAGNPVTVEEQETKLRRLVEVTRKVWP